MTHIEQMIKDMCPHGVEWKQLGEVCNTFMGEFVHKSKQNPNGQYPVYNGGTTPTGFYDEYNTTANKVIISARGAGAGYVNRVETNFWAGNSCHVLEITNPNLDWRFLYYLLKNQESEMMNHQQKGGGVPAISKKQINEIEIPIPPLDIQKKIVECLDKFSALAAELQAELQKRRTQYEYYRTRLLTPPQNISSDDSTDERNWEWKTLGEICIIKNGKDYKHLNDGIYPVYGSGGIMTYKDEYVYDKPSILLPRKGSIGKIHYVDVPFWNVDTAFYTIIDESIILPKYLFYYLNTINLESYNTGTGSIPSLTQTVLKGIPIPIPPLEEQARIVSILDKFEKLLTSMEDGIPAEQAAQQKRYEYYRDKLLTFDRKAV